MIARFYLTAGLLLLIIIFGVWLYRAGKPYNGILFNIHKLVALGAVILTGARLYQLDLFSTFPISVLILIGLASLSVISLFATGAVMSIQSEIKPVFQYIHGISMLFVVGSFLAGLFLLRSGTF